MSAGQTNILILLDISCVSNNNACNVPIYATDEIHNINLKVDILESWHSETNSLVGTRTLSFFICPLFYSCIPLWCKFILQLMPYYSQEILHKKKSEKTLQILTVFRLERFFPFRCAGLASIFHFLPNSEALGACSLSRKLTGGYRTRFTITRGSRGATGPLSVRHRPVSATAANSRTTVGLLFFYSRGIMH